MDDAGNFVVTWSSYFKTAPATACMANATMRREPPWEASSRSIPISIVASIFRRWRWTPSGNFVVTWSSANQDGSSCGVYGQRYDAAGTALGGEFQINTYVSSNQQYSTVAIDAAGKFVVTWSSWNEDGSG